MVRELHGRVLLGKSTGPSSVLVAQLTVLRIRSIVWSCFSEASWASMLRYSLYLQRGQLASLHEARGEVVLVAKHLTGSRVSATFLSKLVLERPWC